MRVIPCVDICLNATGLGCYVQNGMFPLPSLQAENNNNQTPLRTAATQTVTPPVLVHDAQLGFRRRCLGYD